MRKQRDRRGFTLVELIVVLVILAVLAAILVPTLVGYIDQARHQKDYDTAAALEQAAQSTVIEQKQAHPDRTYEMLNAIVSTEKMSARGNVSEGEEVRNLAGVDSSHVKWFYFNVDENGAITASIMTGNLQNAGQGAPRSSQQFPSCVRIDDTVYYMKADGSWGSSKLENGSFTTTQLDIKRFTASGGSAPQGKSKTTWSVADAKSNFS